MSGPDLYAVLGVSRDASVEQLRSAFRRRSRLTHPDQGGDALAFRAVEGAYRILSDPGLRAGYDAELGVEGASASKTSTADSGSDRRPSPDPPRRASRSRAPQRVDFGRIRWSADFVGADGSVLADPAMARIVPGRWWWLWKPVSWALVLVWALSCTWISLERFNSSFAWAALAWAAAWAVTGLVVTVHAAHGRWSALLVASVALAWPAYTAPGELWSWVVYTWLAAAATIPLLRARVRRPAWSTAAATSGSVFGQPSWHAHASGAIVEQLTVIPGVRVLHQVAGSEHVVVLDRRVALVGGPVVAAVGRCPTRTWPMAIAGDPERALEEIGAWLLSDSDPMVVDRRTLAAVARAPHRSGRNFG